MNWDWVTGPQDLQLDTQQCDQQSTSSEQSSEILPDPKDFKDQSRHFEAKSQRYMEVQKEFERIISAMNRKSKRHFRKWMVKENNYTNPNFREAMEIASKAGVISEKRHQKFLDSVNEKQARKVKREEKQKAAWYTRLQQGREAAEAEARGMKFDRNTKAFLKEMIENDAAHSERRQKAALRLQGPHLDDEDEQKTNHLLTSDRRLAECSPAPDNDTPLVMFVLALVVILMLVFYIFRKPLRNLFSDTKKPSKDIRRIQKKPIMWH